MFAVMIHQSPCFEQDFHAFVVSAKSGFKESRHGSKWCVTDDRIGICARLESST